MAERPMNPGDSPCSSEETRMEEPVVSREPAQDAVVQPNTTCAQCKKEVKSPHLLCCLHSACVECLPGMVAEGQRIKCGECGDTSTHCSSSSKGVENQCGAEIVHCVPVPNGPLSRYMEGVKIVGKASNQASIPCGNNRCKTPDSPSTVYCTDCSIFMCERCNGAHELAPPCEDHSVKTLHEMGELSPDDCQKMFSKSPAVNTCPRHRGRVLEYCCEQCSLLMCQACAIEFKPPHKPKEITTDSAIAEPHRQSLRAAHQATVCFGKKCEAVEEQLQTELRTVDQTTEASLGGLNTAFQSIYEAVERRKEELHRQIINSAEEKKTAIGSRLSSVQTEKKTVVGNAGSTLEFLLKNGSTHDLLASKDLIQTHQSVLNSKWCEDELENTVSSVLSFEAANQEAALKAIAGFGIVADGACPEKCTVEPKPDQLRVQLKGSDPETLKVVTFDSKAIACMRRGEKIKAILHPKPPIPGPAIKARVVDNDNGTYSVFFPSVYPGPCVLSIGVNGRDIRGSPFEITLHHSSHRNLSRNVQNINGPKGHLHFPQQPGGLWGVAVSPEGTIVVSDRSGHKIHVFGKDRKHITSFGTQGSGEGQLNSPYGLTVSSDGLVYVANYSNGRIEVFREDGTFVQQIGSGQLKNPIKVTIHNQQLYIADNSSHTVSVYTLQGQHVHTIGSSGNGPGQFSNPSAVAFSPDGDMYVVDCSNHRVQVFDANGQYKREFGQGQLLLKYPRDIVITCDGDVLVANQSTNHVAVFSTCGNTNNLHHSFEVKGPNFGLAIDNDGNILVASSGNNQVTIF